MAPATVDATLSRRSKTSSREPSKRSAHRCAPVPASINCAVMRTREPALRVGRSEGAHARLLAAGLRWAHDVTGDADNAVLLAEQIQGSGGLFREADHSARRKTWA